MGKCFGCGKEGHMARNYPDNAAFRSQGQGPLGTSSFSMEPATETTSDDQAKVLDSLPLGSIFYDNSEGLISGIKLPVGEWMVHYPYRQQPQILAQGAIGDCYTMVANAILTLGVPFLGDEQYDVSQLIPKLWFHVSWKAKTDYYVVDDMLVGEHLTIALLQLKDPSFNVSHWYAEQRKQILGLTNSKRYCHCIGNVISVVALKLLTDGILSSYLCTDQWLNADS